MWPALGSDQVVQGLVWPREPPQTEAAQSFWAPVPVFDCSHAELFLYDKSEPLFSVHTDSVILLPFTSVNMDWLCLLCNILIGIAKLLSGPPKPPLRQTKQAQLPEASNRASLPVPAHVCAPLLDSLVYKHPCCAGDPKLDVVLQIWSIQSAEEGMITASLVFLTVLLLIQPKLLLAFTAAGSLLALFLPFCLPGPLPIWGPALLKSQPARGYSIPSVGFYISSL